MILLQFLVFSVVVSTVINFAECAVVPEYQADFIKQSMDTYKMVVQKIKECCEKAKNIAQEKGSCQFNRHTMFWMSMYASNCNIGEKQFKEDLKLTMRNFPFRLNKELRCTLYQGRDVRIREIFQAVGNITDRALEELYPFISSKPLFRGVTSFPYRNEARFVENGFFSASKDVNVALQFAEGNTLLIINGMEGVSIERYAEAKFKYQKEVLAKRNSVFNLEPVVTDKDRINQIIGKLGADINQPKPKEIIYLNQVNDLKAEDVDRITLVQQQRAHDYCAPK